MVGIIRRHMEDAGFLDIQTPILYKSTPEGARDFVVPSRLHKGRFFALPQSPQTLKQLTMIAGFDRYYQIAICFRDEDLRADRVQELTQLDVEMSFPDQEMLFDLMERMFATIWRDCVGVEIPTPWPRMTYEEADRRFGSDKPDTRFALEIEDATAATRGSEFGVFAGAEAVRFLRVPRTYSRAEIAALEEIAKERGAKGLAYLARDAESGELRSPIAKFLSEGEIEALAPAAGETLLFAADAWDTTSKVLGHLRLHLGRELGLIDDDAFTFLWVTDFPMFEWDEDEGRWSAKHHPFTRPGDEWKTRFAEEPGKALAHAYDIIVNGNELGGGSFRIHEPDIQARVFDLLALTEEQQRAQFGFLLDALAMGAPPHGGIALGIDRMTMVLAGRAEPARRDRVPEEPGGPRPDVGRPVSDHAGAAGRARARGRRRGGADLSPAVVVRLLSLAAAALLAGLVAVAVVERGDAEVVPVSPQGAVAAGGGWYDALAAPRPPAGDAERTSCGLTLTATVAGRDASGASVRREAARALRRRDDPHRGDRQRARRHRAPVRADAGARPARRARRHAAGRVALRDTAVAVRPGAG